MKRFRRETDDVVKLHPDSGARGADLPLQLLVGGALVRPDCDVLRDRPLSAVDRRISLTFHSTDGSTETCTESAAYSFFVITESTKQQLAGGRTRRCHVAAMNIALLLNVFHRIAAAGRT
jgi:hypothetical protein